MTGFRRKWDQLALERLPADQALAARVLRGMLLGLLLWLIPWATVAMPFIVVRKAGAVVLCVLLLAASTACWLLLKRGKIRPGRCGR